MAYEPKQGKGGDIQFGVDNILLKYDNYSYRFSIIMPHINEAQNISRTATHTSGTSREFIIAESGTTHRYTIDSVEIDMLPPGDKTLNTTARTMKIIIIEAGSMRFYDDLLTAMKLQGYERQYDAPIIVELDFIGYNGDSGESEVINSTKYQWLMRFRDIKMASTSSHGDVNKYTLELLPLIMHHDKRYLNLDGIVNVEATPTVGKVIESLENAVNNSFSEKYPHIKQTVGVDKIFTFHIDPSLYDLKMKGSGEDIGTYNNQGNIEFTFNKDHDIKSAIHEIFSSVLNDGDKDQSADKTRRVLTNIIPKATYLQEDTANNTVVYKYDIYILRYESFDVQSYHEMNNELNVNSFTKKFESSCTNPNIKQYYYANTGLNTEIIKLDLDFNVAFRYFYTQNTVAVVDTGNLQGLKVAKTQNDITQEQNQISSVTSMVQPKSETESGRIYLENIQYEDIPLFTIKTEANADNNITDGDKGTNDPSKVARHDQGSNYYSPQFMVKVKLDVVGDPYWLGYSDKEFLAMISNPINRGENSNADFYRQEALLQLNLQTTPVRSDDNPLSISESSLNQSIYRVRRVKSTFKGGRFTQQLDAIIIKSTRNKK